MVERDNKLTEQDIKEKFLKYKRFSIEQINPELLSRRDLSFVEEVNKTKRKNNAYPVYKNRNKDLNKEIDKKINNNLNIHFNQSNYKSQYASSINVLQQNNVLKNANRKQEKKDKEEKKENLEVNNTEYSLNLLKLVSSYVSDNVKIENPDKNQNAGNKANPLNTPEFNKVSTNEEADSFIDALYSDNIKVSKHSKPTEVKDTITNNQSNAILNKKEEKEKSLKIKTTFVKNNKKIIDDDELAHIEVKCKGNEIHNNSITNSNLLGSFSKKVANRSLIEKESFKKDAKEIKDKEKTGKRLKKTEDKLIEVNDLKEAKENCNEKTLFENVDSHEVSDFMMKVDTTINIEGNIKDDKIIDDKNNAINEIPQEISSPTVKNYSNKILIDSKPNTNIEKIIEEKIVNETNNNRKESENENSIIRISESKSMIKNELEQDINRIQSEIIKGLNLHLKGNNKINTIEDYQKSFDVTNKILEGNFIKISNIFDKFPTIVSNLVDIVTNYEEVVEKEFDYKYLINLLDYMLEKLNDKHSENETENENKFFDQVKKVLKYIKCNLKMKQYEPRKTVIMIQEFNNIFKGKKKENAKINELKKDFRDMLKFSDRFSKYLEANSKMITFFNKFKPREISSKQETEEIKGYLKINYNYLSLKMIAKVTTMAMNIILRMDEKVVICA